MTQFKKVHADLREKTARLLVLIVCISPQMMDPVRIAASAVFLGSIVMVFVSAFALGIDALVM